MWVGWLNVVVSLVLELLFLSQTAKIISKISWKYFGMLILFSLECSCQYGVENGHIMAGWVGECCGELGTPSTNPKSNTKECFFGIF